MKGNLNIDTKRENILWGQADNTGRHVKMETETEIMCLTSKGTAKAAGKHQKLEEKHGTASSQSLQKKLIPPKLMSEFQPPELHERIYFCHCKSPSMCYFVLAALGTGYTILWSRPLYRGGNGGTGRLSHLPKSSRHSVNDNSNNNNN